ncbi:uncharacterized protein LOC135088176 [Ostrinia nubilalis]|uniref:uncharacterized protein LOC135088176 n=1 Tax=Ostrinia nubilalis TaxID=29057 RepID=UPI0030823680
MRRKSERTASKKTKSPEKKIEKVKRTRTRRRKQSTSSDNESADETTPVQVVETVTEVEKKPPGTPAKEDSPGEAHDQVWQVKAAEGGDVGEIQKLKICLTRPPSTPERVDRSPRSKRKHSRATSSSDTPSNEGVEERKKSKHRSKRSTRESKDDSEKNHDSQEEADVDADSQNVKDKSDCEISQSSDKKSVTTSDDTPMSTTNEESKVSGNVEESSDKQESQNKMEVEVEVSKPSDADTTVASPKVETTVETTVVSSDTVEMHKSEERENEESNKDLSEDKSEVLELHAEDRCESSDTELNKSQTKDTSEAVVPEEKDQAKEASKDEVSNTEDKTDKSKKTVCDSNENKSSDETHVVESSEKTVEVRKLSVESSKEEKREVEESHDTSKDMETSISNISSQEENVQNGSTTSIVISRKRRWGSRPTKITKQKSITISTDILKEIIPDVKPVEFEEVIKEKKPEREVTEKIERPILPKIIIDNTEHVEQHKKVNEDKDRDVMKPRESHLSSNRKISIVKESDSIIARPPSPPRYKQSCILFITNLVRPFTLPQLKNLLQRTGRIVEDGFWIDRIKSKCYVKYETEDQAVETRHALHGVTWPVSNPKTLQVDFSTDEAFDKAKLNEDADNAQVSTIPGTVEDWLREQDMKRERGEMEKPYERKAVMREWDVGKNEKDKDKEKMRRSEDLGTRMLDKRRHRSPERSPEPARKFKKKEEEAPAKLLDDLFRKTKTTPCIYWLPLSAETIAVKEEQRRQHMAEHERRLQELRRTHRRHYHLIGDVVGTPLWVCADLSCCEATEVRLNTARHVSKTLQVRSPWYVWALLVATALAQEPFTLSEFLGGQFAQRGFGATWISDTEFTFTVAGEPGIHIFDVPTLNRSVLVPGELMEFLNTTNPVLSADRQYILASSEVEQVYRYSTTAKYTLYEILTGAVTTIANGQRLQLCIFGGGHSLAYVLDNNLYYLPENSVEPIQITSDGIPGIIYNGHTDWVYEEDVMYTGQATWFSTDGSYLAFASFNDTLVESYSYYYYEEKSDPDDVYPELVDLKYPKVGRTNPTVQLRVVNLTSLVQGQDIDFLVLEAPEIVTDDHILGGVVWARDNEIAAHWLNRRQNQTVLRICNLELGTDVCEEEHRSQPNGWVPIALPRFSSDGSFYVSTRWSMPQADGYIWQHLYMSVRVNGEIISSSISPGLSTVNNYVGMDETNVAYYFTRTVEGAPWRSQVRRLGAGAEACISCDIVMPDGGVCTWATATASLGGTYLSITCSSSNEPSATYIVRALTSEILYQWEDNAIVRERLQNKLRPVSIITTVPLENGHPAPVRLHLPPGIDLNDTTTKYPLVYYVYSGPNTNTVFDTFTVGYHSIVATNHDTIYLLADGRGAGLNGQDILYSLNNALGTVEIEDHFVILKQVLERYEFIDPSRVAIWGHSYGGYATLLTLLHDDEHMFQCGVSGAPVTSWLYYNTMYTERYMGLPTEEDNLSGYQAGDVTLLAEKLRGHDFYIMHGNADDNVHYQNAVKLYRALQELEIPFEQMSYPDEAHSLVGVNMHRYNTMNRYFQRCIGMPAAKV